MEDIFETLSKYNSKLEIKFSDSDNANVNKVCLVFIKIPITSSTKAKTIQDMIHKDHKPPLSKGRLEVQKIPKRKSHIFVGILRVKDIHKMYSSIETLLNKMQVTIQQASGSEITRWKQEVVYDTEYRI